jgi:aminoglycoside phosphotransferase (APT) family kinase protein
MRPGEFPIDASLVRRLPAAQFPRWAEQPLKRFPSTGTVNALYRLGDDLAVCLPRIEGGAEDVGEEAHWVPRLAPLLPAAVPEILATGTPGEGYP